MYFAAHYKVVALCGAGVLSVVYQYKMRVGVRVRAALLTAHPGGHLFLLLHPLRRAVGAWSSMNDDEPTVPRRRGCIRGPPVSSSRDRHPQPQACDSLPFSGVLQVQKYSAAFGFGGSGQHQLSLSFSTGNRSY